MSPTVDLAPARSDALPEGTDYRDTGCSHYARCLSCPLSCCLHDLKPSDQRAHFRLTPRLAYWLFRHGRTVAQVQQTLKVSRRTAYRYLADFRQR